MWDIFYKVAHQSSFFWAKSSVSAATRTEVLGQTRGTFFEKNIEFFNDKWEIPISVLVRLEE
jgi:hypothetical protein